MADPALLDDLPDLVVLVRRDGALLGHGGGRGLPQLQPPDDGTARSVQEIWPAPVAELVSQLTRRAIALRGNADTTYRDEHYQFDARAYAQGPDRALCVLRALTARGSGEASATADDAPGPHLDRRGLIKRFNQSVAMAQLAERAMAAAVIQVDGITDIARAIDARLAEQVLANALQRIPADLGAAKSPVLWYLGQFSDHTLLMVVECGEREIIESLVVEVCASLRVAVGIGDASFSVSPFAGVAVLGQDAATAESLLDHARNAASDARRAGNQEPRFFSDTVRIRSLARLDLTRELRDAIRNREIRLRYVGRHDLASGRLVACVGYLHWHHPLRGDVRPAEFLAVAEAAGLALPLSRSILECFATDYRRLHSLLDASVCVSLGVLRHHLVRPDFAAEMLSLLRAGSVPAERVELRIAERSFVSLDGSRLRKLAKQGMQLIVDEMGRGLGSLDMLASAPLTGLQLDRSWVSAVPGDLKAQRICRAGLAVAAALGLTPIAMGVDSIEKRDVLLALGCVHGLGDLYRRETLPI